MSTMNFPLVRAVLLLATSFIFSTRFVGATMNASLAQNMQQGNNSNQTSKDFISLPRYAPLMLPLIAEETDELENFFCSDFGSSSTSNRILYPDPYTYTSGRGRNQHHFELGHWRASQASLENFHTGVAIKCLYELMKELADHDVSATTPYAGGQYSCETAFGNLELDLDPTNPAGYQLTYEDIARVWNDLTNMSLDVQWESGLPFFEMTVYGMRGPALQRTRILSGDFYGMGASRNAPAATNATI